jgi:hypothetical protein
MKPEVPMDKDLERIKRNFQEMSDAVLQEEYLERSGEYEPDALALLKSELERRGMDPGQLDELAAGGGRPGAEPQEPAVVVATFASLTFAQEAQALLEEHGIDAYLQGAESEVWGHESLAEVPEAVRLWVLEEDAEDAREILAEFPPAQGEEAAEEGAGDEEEP